MTEPVAVTDRTAVLASNDEEMRLLLRGLLRVQRFRVVAESSGAGQAVELVRSQRPRVLLVDSRLSEGNVGDLVARARGAESSVRIVLVLPSHPRSAATREGKGADAILHRPFELREFFEAVEPGSSEAPSAGRTGALPSATGGQR